MKLQSGILAIALMAFAVIFSCDARAQNYSVLTTWNAVTPPAGVTWVVSGYNVYRADTPGGYTMGTHISPLVTAATWTDTTVQNGKTYYYNVTTWCGSCTAGKQESQFGPEAKVVVPSPVADIGPPTNPGGLVVVPIKIPAH